MGYTHYWSFKTPPKGQTQGFEKKYQQAIAKCNEIIKFYQAKVKRLDKKHPDRLSGYSAFTKGYGGLKVNGTGDLSHEDFCMREHLKQNQGDFCKTARKPYDVVVVACLIILKHYLGDLFQVESDGFAEDWRQGLFLATKATRLKTLKIPISIEARQKIALVEAI